MTSTPPSVSDQHSSTGIRRDYEHPSAPSEPGTSPTAQLRNRVHPTGKNSLSHVGQTQPLSGMSQGADGAASGPASA